MKLEQFLVKAKIATYATSGEGGEKNLEDGSKEMTFSDGEYNYRDRYFGFNPFVGEEIVWQGDKVIWSMNYYGKILDSELSDKDVYTFLQKSMRHVTEDRPFRGPENFKDGDLEYIDKSQGDTNEFSGEEKILYKNIEIYRLVYHGGRVEK